MNYDFLKLQLKGIITSRAGLLTIATLGSFAAAVVALRGYSSESFAPEPRLNLTEETASSFSGFEDRPPSILDLPERYREQLLAPLKHSTKKPTSQSRFARWRRDRDRPSPLSNYWNRIGGSTQRKSYRNWLASRGTKPGETAASEGKVREEQGSNAIDRASQKPASIHSETTLLAQRERPLSLTPTDVIALALASDPTAKETYLKWLARHRDRAGAKRTASAEVNGRESDPTFRTKTILEIDENLAIEIHSESEDRDKTNTIVNVDESIVRHSQQLTPIHAGNFSEEEIDRKIQYLNLRKELEATVTGAILAYRNFLVYQNRAKIEEDALVTAKAIVERDKKLIETGQLPQSDRALGQEWIAYLETRLNRAKNAADRARLALLNLLELDPNLNIVAIETLEITPPEIAREALQTFSFATHPDYVLSQLEIERAKEAFARAENDRRLLNSQKDRKTKIKTLESESDRGRIAVMEAQRSIANLEENLKVELSARLENLEQSWQRLEPFQQARSRAEQNLEIELGQRAFGQTELLTVAQWQNEVINAKNAELQATVNYLNALAQLDRAIGNTLNTWNIEFRDSIFK